MKPVTWVFEGRVPASPDAVYAWLSDFCEDDHARPAYLRGAGMREGKHVKGTRRVLAHDGNTVTIEDRWGFRSFRTRVTLDPEQRALHIAGDNGYGATWSAIPEGAGTRLIVEGRLAPTGVVGLAVPLFARGLRHQMEQDFLGHLEDLRSSLAAAEAPLLVA